MTYIMLGYLAVPFVLLLRLFRKIRCRMGWHPGIETDRGYICTVCGERMARRKDYE